MNTKLEFTVSFPENGINSLHLYKFLFENVDAWSKHEKIKVRHPLGIYNISLNKIFKRIKKCSEILEEIFALHHISPENNATTDIEEHFFDYLELCLYAGAEHIDDLEIITRCLYKNKIEYRKSRLIKNLNGNIKPKRDYIAKITNTLKHNQGRFRFYSADLGPALNNLQLHGVFVDSASGNMSGPCEIVHNGTGVVLSVTTLLWEIMIFAFELSTVVSNSLFEHGIIPGSDLQRHSDLCGAVKALARLPLYVFDENHPFDRVTFKLVRDIENKSDLDSGIIGSINHPWPKNIDPKHVSSSIKYIGDGATRSFATFDPQTISLHHWN